ncbi:alkaline protease [Myriangium duriaei CBS 260.36]|uniref:Alkaline protease n=1 Tax=Myriangium duriaei CBS 260.36 TaxID=1168546 RepID=A0A9P4J6V0_9PEZI|nr:alkaline protease [Myriangium duriaei CBS 260.36]
MTQHMNIVQDMHVQSLSSRQDGKVFEGILHEYRISNFQGYAGHFDSTVIEQLRRLEDVEDIELDQIGCITAEKQPAAPYGLSLISHRNASDESHDYVYDKSAGKGTYAYIIDSGIDIQHTEFESRATFGYSGKTMKPGKDLIGHGSHVAGIAGGKTYGVAKRCNLVAVKVTNFCLFSYSAVMAGLDWAVKDIQAKGRHQKAVINISLGGPKSASFNRAIDATFDAGILIVVAAGNRNSDVAKSSPGSAVGAVTIASTDQSRIRYKTSNWGSGITLFAPGVNIPSAWIGAKRDAFVKLSGTSMAAPHVSGLALYLQGLKSFPNAKALREALLRLALRDVVGDPKGSPNLFAYNNGGSRV